MTATMYYPCKRVMTLPTVQDALAKLNVPEHRQDAFITNAAINQSAAIVIPLGNDPAAVAIIQVSRLEGVTAAHVMLGFLDAMAATEADAIANWPEGDPDPIYAMEYRQNEWGDA